MKLTGDVRPRVQWCKCLATQGWIYAPLYTPIYLKRGPWGKAAGTLPPACESPAALLPHCHHLARLRRCFISRRQRSHQPPPSSSSPVAKPSPTCPAAASGEVRAREGRGGNTEHAMDQTAEKAGDGRVDESLLHVLLHGRLGLNKHTWYASKTNPS